jgi:hypothetical protein
LSNLFRLSSQGFLAAKYNFAFAELSLLIAILAISQLLRHLAGFAAIN